MIFYLQKALMDRFNSSAGATLRGLVQGMWESAGSSELALGTQEARELEKSTLPIIVFETLLTGLEQDFCTNMFIPLVQFSILGDGNNKTSNAVLLIGEEFLSLYGDVILSMDGGYTMIRSDTVDMSKFKDDNKFHNLVYAIEYQIEKER